MASAAASLPPARHPARARGGRVLLVARGHRGLRAARAASGPLARSRRAARRRWSATQARVERVRGEARVKVESAGGGGTVTQFVAAERPDRLRLDALDFFGNPAAALVADGGRFALLDLREGVFYRGAATPENLARLVPLPIPASELVAPALRRRPDRCGGVRRRSSPATACCGSPWRARTGCQRLDVGAGAAVHASTVVDAPGQPLRREAGTTSPSTASRSAAAGRSPAWCGSRRPGPGSGSISPGRRSR